MATYSDGKGYDFGTGTAYVAAGTDKVSAVTVELDFEKITTARSDAGLSVLSAADVLRVIRVPAHTHVLAVNLEVTRAEGNTLTVDVGDGSDPDGYHDGVNANIEAAYSLDAGGAAAFGHGKFYTSSDTIDVTIVNVALRASMKLSVVMVDCS